MANGSHSIPMPEAAALTLRWRRNTPAGGFQAARFDRDILDSILVQPGCQGMRIYMGLHDPNDPAHQNDKSMWTFVIVGTDDRWQ